MLITFAGSKHSISVCFFVSSCPRHAWSLWFSCLFCLLCLGDDRPLSSCSAWNVDVVECMCACITLLFFFFLCLGLDLLGQQNLELLDNVLVGVLGSKNHKKQPNRCHGQHGRRSIHLLLPLPPFQLLPCHLDTCLVKSVIGSFSSPYAFSLLSRS